MTERTLTVGVPTYGHWAAGGTPCLLETVRALEGAGAARVSVTDHVLMGRDTSEYPFGAFPVDASAPWLEPLSFLAAAAAVTRTLRLETRVLIAPLRPAALLAKTVATIDHLSDGRLDLGVGTGWLRDEFDAQGLDVERRGELLTDTIGACRELWAGAPSTYHSASVDFTEVFSMPVPRQGRLPVWFGGSAGRRNLDRISRFGDGWIPAAGASVDDVRAGAALVQALARNPASPAVATVQVAIPVARDERGIGEPFAAVDDSLAYFDAGATDVVIDLGAVCADPADGPAVAEQLCRRFHHVVN